MERWGAAWGQEGRLGATNRLTDWPFLAFPCLRAEALVVSLSQVMRAHTRGLFRWVHGVATRARDTTQPCTRWELVATSRGQSQDPTALPPTGAMTARSAARTRSLACTWATPPSFRTPTTSCPMPTSTCTNCAWPSGQSRWASTLLWSVEHHFTDYTMCPDVLQFLAYMAGKTQRVKLGSMVVVVPWHDPVRVTEQVILLDHLSNGRLILGIGRGLARVEYEGFRLEQHQGRARFLEYAALILQGLEHGYIEGGATLHQPRRALRPFPRQSFRGRTYAAAVSPESMPIMAQLGVGLLIIPQKPWSDVQHDLTHYREVYQEVNGVPAPPPLCVAFCVVDEDAARAEAMADQYIGGYYHTAMRHYEMTAEHFGTQQGYEFYRKVRHYIGRHGPEGAARDFTHLMPWGTPAQVLEKLADDAPDDPDAWTDLPLQLCGDALRRGRAEHAVFRDARASSTACLGDTAPARPTLARHIGLLAHSGGHAAPRCQRRRRGVPSQRAAR